MWLSMYEQLRLGFLELEKIMEKFSWEFCVSLKKKRHLEQGQNPHGDQNVLIQ